MLYLGFLKFLKRDRGKEPKLEMENLEGLDIPPLPPDLGEKGIGELPELPEMPAIDDEELISDLEEPMPELEIPKEKLVSKLDLIPSLELEKDKQLFAPKPKPIFGAYRAKVEAAKPELEAEVPYRHKPKMTHYKRLETAAIREETAVLRHKKAEDHLYIMVGRFRDILTGTNAIKTSLVTASQSIVKLNAIDINRDKVLEKWHNVMTDLQKKLIFIDKTLFKR